MAAYKPSPMNRTNVGRGRGSQVEENRGSGKLAGTNNAKYRYNLARQNQKNGFNLGGLGGLLGGGGGSDYTYEDLQRQLEYDKMIWERSTPNVGGVGANVTWDRDTNTVSSALSEDNQAIYDAANKRQGMFGEQVDYLAAGGWEDAQQKRFKQMQAMYKDQDDEAALLRKESNYATGATLNQEYMDQLAERKGIDNRELGMLNQSFNESQQLIDNNMLRQTGYIAQRSDLENMANGLIQMPTPDTRGNMANVSTASTRWADELNMKQLKKSQGKSKIWDAILGGGSSLFGV